MILGVSSVRKLSLSVVTAIGLTALGMIALGAEPEKKEIPVEMTKPLIEREPYDLVTLAQAKNGKGVRIKPLDFSGGRPPRGGQVRVELMDQPGRMFEIAWRDVVRYQQFPQLLMEDAQAQLKAKNFDLTFRYLQRLKAEYPTFPGTQPILEELLVQNAFERYQAGAWAESLGMLEEAHRRFPNRPNLDSSIEKVTGQLIQSQIDAHKWGAARELIERIQKSYGNKFDTEIAKWRSELAQLAETEMASARRQIQQQDYRSALRSTELALSIRPDDTAGQKQLAELMRRYPQVRIATMAQGELTPPHSTMTWSGRRNKRLFYRDLAEIVGYGPEGGEYISPFGSVLRPADRFELSIVLRERLTPVTGFDLSRQLQLASPEYDPMVSLLTPLIEDLSVHEIREVDLRLRVAHLRPEALLGFVPRQGDWSKPVPLNGPFRPAKFQADGSVFAPTPETKAAIKQVPSEIQLLPYSTSADALAALKAGDVHMIDRLDPLVALELLTETPEDLVVDHYRAPTLHILVPNLDNPYLQNRDFRRGLLYGINRQEILSSRLLAGQELDGCRMVSAPIPSGVSPNDPVSYGYDLSIAPREYEPQMSLALRTMAELKMRKEAEEKKEALVPLGKLILGHPDTEISRQSCLAISQYLKKVGLPCELKVVSAEATNPADVGCDLLYAEVQITEPLVDVPRMFDRYVPKVHQRQYFQLALRQLGEAQDWQDLRERFWSLHQLAHDDLLIIPMFQLQDYFVYRRSLGGVGYQPMTLFQQVERWNIAPVLDVVKN